MQHRTLILLSFLLAATFLVQRTAAKCNACSENGIACTSERSFNVCFNGQRDTSQDFTCPPGKVCTSLRLKCVDAGNVPPDCMPNKGCGLCSGGRLFACTSRTTFAQCNGTELTTVTGTCPSGLTCDSTQSEICVDDCNLPAEIECDRPAPL